MADKRIRALLIVSTCCFSWMTMMVVHEFGHVLHAWVSGGRVTSVVLHPLTISRTDVNPNPHRHFERWGGCVWGSLLPIVVWLITRWSRLSLAFVIQFFAGFCLIANGAYLSSGVWWPVGDARDLLELGTPRWVLGAFGVVAVSTGLWLWNGLGQQFGIGRSAVPIDPKAAYAMAIATGCVVAVEFAVSILFNGS